MRCASKQQHPTLARTKRRGGGGGGGARSSGLEDSQLSVGMLPVLGGDVGGRHGGRAAAERRAARQPRLPRSQGAAGSLNERGTWSLVFRSGGLAARGLGRCCGTAAAALRGGGFLHGHPSSVGILRERIAMISCSRCGIGPLQAPEPRLRN